MVKTKQKTRPCQGVQRDETPGNESSHVTEPLPKFRSQTYTPRAIHLHETFLSYLLSSLLSLSNNRCKRCFCAKAEGESSPLPKSSPFHSRFRRWIQVPTFSSSSSFISGRRMPLFEGEPSCFFPAIKKIE